MLSYAIRRILALIPTLFVIATLVFIAMRVAPGDPAIAMAGGQADDVTLQGLRARLGVDKPILVQYTNYLWGLFHGDLGNSYKTNIPVRKLLAMNLPYTLQLVLAATVIGILVGIPLGILSAVNRNGLIDYVSRMLSLVGVSIPLFYLGLLILLFFALKLSWFPTMGVGREGDMLDQLYHLILPATAAGLLMASYVARETRSSFLEVILQDYIKTAYAKGLKDAKVLYKHAIRNALVPIVTLVGIYINVLLASSVMLEVVYSRPGLGRMILGAIKQYDYMVLQSTVLVFALMVGVVNLIVDLSYVLINPEMRVK